jgi:antirestriction protein ArdC
MSKKIYEMVTDRILEQLEKGTIPWRRPWTANGMAVSWDKQKPYRGINALVLPGGEYATYKQIEKAGGTVKKGSKGFPVVFWKWLDVEDEDTGEQKRIPFLRYFTVFEINSQAEGIESKRKEQSFDHDPIQTADDIVKSFKDSPKVYHAPGRAYYRPSDDLVSVPEIRDYERPQEYYSVLFHELAHATGHASRLNRSGIAQLSGFGSDPYAREELIAEMGAAMLCGIAQIDNDQVVENQAAYIDSWRRKLKDEPQLIVQAAAAGQKAADYIQGVKYDN